MSNQDDLFVVKDFKDTLKELFISLYDSLKESKRKAIRDQIRLCFDDENNQKTQGEVTPLVCVENMLDEVSNNIAYSKINSAKLNAIRQICKTLKKYSKGEEGKEDKKDKEDKEDEKLKSPILDFVKKTRNRQIYEIQRQIMESNRKVIDLAQEKDFMISQINNKLAKISKDLDEYITTNLNLNDPVELDKTDKKMTRTVIDAVHITNNLNVELKTKSGKKKNQD
ncbi:hypothetical protein M9Y10_025415 [Tritrichomonas musculus]|uniref:Uncharacterized protein n=1 Tax=Tritrichomonas musculus TaxID=1915356 RepID=A0ABR2H8K6_9EUKA